MKQWWVYELCAGPWRYIGMTTNPEERLRFHRLAIARHPEKPRTSNWHQALREYPDFESWEMRVLSGPFETKDEAIAEEARLQTEDWDRHGRVWEKCGDRNSDETKAKLSEAMTGENNPNFGKQHSKETKAKLSEALSGENNPNFGKTPSDETKAKIREALSGENHPMYGQEPWNKGKKHSDATRAKMREGHARRRAEKAISSD